MKCLAVQSRPIPHLSPALICVLWTCGLLCAQQPPASESPPPARAPSGDLIRESDLKWRLEDEDGNLVPVPAFTLELFQELLELQNRIKTQPAALPKAIFTRPIELEGQVDPEGRFATLQVTYRIKLPASVDLEEDYLTAIPLRLDNSYLDVSAIEHEEEGEIDVTRDGASYVCWLHAAPASNHTIRVAIKVPVRRTGTQGSLSIALPDMATKLVLTVPQAAIEAFSASERSNVSWTAEGDATVITVESGGGELDLSWQGPGQVLSRALEATCATTVHVHGNRIWSEAQLKVRSRAEPVDSFLVRLPEGMALTPRSDADFQITRLPPSDDIGSEHVLVKRLSGSTRGLIEVNLEAELPLPVTDETQRRTVQLAGFSVQDAVKEWGSVDVMVEGNWSTTWLLGQHVQRIAVLEDATRRQPAAARFLYDGQPYSLRVELRPRQTRGSLDITYIVDVADDGIQLDARIAYSTNGTAGDLLSFKMPGWTNVTVTPPESLARPFTFDEADGTLTLPIATDATEFDFQVRAGRPVEMEATDVSFDLPRPADARLLPNAALIVLASDNVELTPELASMKGLIQETRTPTLELPERLAVPLLFREELSSESNEAAQFVARRRIRPRETTVAVASDAALAGDTVQVRHSFLVTVAYARLSELTIAIPADVVESGTLEITSNEQELTYRDAMPEPAPELDAAEAADRVPTETTVVVISLPAPLIGELQVDISFEIPRDNLTSADRLRIPLVQPADDEATENVTNTLTVRSDENTAITLADEFWTIQPDDAAASSGKHELRVRATGVVGSALVRTAAVESRTSGNTQIPRVWIQSLLTPTDRRDRVCFQLLSDQPRVHIQLPSTAQSKGLWVLVEGQRPIELVNHGDHSLTITLADDQVGRVVGLEISYFCVNSRDSRFGVAIPSIIDADRAELVYWQIVLPRDEHLAWIPTTLTSELVWQRDQWYWGRRGRLEQQSLEGLVGASTRESVSRDTNRYLFSSTGSVNAVGFVKVSRLMLMLASSGLVLGAVLPFIYLPILRRPVVFVVVGVILLAGAVTYPEQALMLGQAGGIGLGLAMVACALRRLVGGATMAPATRRGSVYITPDSQASAAPSRAAEGSSRVTTATAPAHLQVARVEGDS